MASDNGRKRSEPSPWINLFWLFLFLPVTWILRLLWKKKSSLVERPAARATPSLAASMIRTMNGSFATHPQPLFRI